ncbi:helix-turn-helix domain-containing protein [Rubritalea tangerina]|uniref:Helix-turn-helix domain-containing protein n=1 Tax=Rubritalea tangerina TaxID=430798 RepID=A0ABW4ZFD4_9BACT
MRRTMGRVDKSMMKKRTIGLVMDFFNPKLLEGAQAYCVEHGLLLDARWSVRGDWAPKDIKWDGVIFGLVDQEAILERMRALRIPSMDLVREGSAQSVTPDYQACGRMAVEELLRVGVKAMLIPVLSPRQLDQKFAQGAQEAVRASGLREVSVFGDDVQVYDRLMRKVKALHREGVGAIGLCLPHAGTAFSLIQQLEARGLQVPRDVAIVVIDKDAQRTAELAPVPLTTVELNEWHRGFVAAERVHRKMEGEQLVHSHISIPPHGIHGRTSTGHVEEKDPVMAKALSFLHAHYRAPIGVPEVAEAAGASRRVLEMRFREILNTSVHEELRRLRIEDAKQMLLESEKSVTEIAGLCGFSSVHYFSAAFKRVAGQSPRQFQKASQ